MEFVERITALLEERGISKNKMLKEVGIASGAFGNWQRRGTIPRGETLQKLADYFNVSTDYLLGRESTKTIQILAKGGSHRVVEVTEEELALVEEVLKSVRQARYQKRKNHI